MPRKSKKQMEFEVIGVIAVVAIVAIGLMISALYRFFADNPGFLFVIPIIVIPAGWFLFRQRKRAAEQRLQDEREREERAEEERLQRVREEREKEEKRVQEIMIHQSKWGEENCQLLIERKVRLGMTSEMILLAIGEPTSIDDKLITQKEEKYRWIYGRPRMGATYIWFKNGTVTKIKQ